MHKRNLWLFGMALLTHPAFSQNEDWRLYKTENPKSTELIRESNNDGKVRYIQDDRISLMDSLKKANPAPMEGFRVQIYFGSRAEANKVRIEFLRSHPEVGAYVTYLAPNFRLRVGDYRNRTEAEGFKREVNKTYPGSYIVADQISLPALSAKREKNTTEER